MPRYLVQFSYTAEGLEGVMKEGGSGRREASRQLVESFGGHLESYYFAFGNYDGIAIVDMPDNVAMAAVAATVGSKGAVSVKTTVLLEPEDIDAITKRRGTYRPPGQ